MTRASQIQWEIDQLHGLLAEVADSEISCIQIRSRIKGLEGELQAETPTGEMFPRIEPTLPRAAVFLVGESMNGQGIRAGLAGEVLNRYEKLFREQALHDERTTRKDDGHARRRRGTQEPSLLLTGTPRGSFGFEFSPIALDHEMLALHGQSLKNVATAVTSIADPAMNPDSISDHLPRGMLSHIVAFFKVLASNDLSIRFAFQDQAPTTISADSIRNASSKLEQRVEIEEMKVRGKPRGATMKSGHFDFVQDDGFTISGFLDEQMDDEDRKQIINLNDHPADAIIELTTVTLLNGQKRREYILKQIIPIVDEQPPPAGQRQPRSIQFNN